MFIASEKYKSAHKIKQVIKMKEEERDLLAEALERYESLEAQAVDGITIAQMEDLLKQCFE